MKHLDEKNEYDFWKTDEFMTILRLKSQFTIVCELRNNLTNNFNTCILIILR